MSERDGGWITLRMRGEIEQEIGQTYFFVCDKIIGINHGLVLSHLEMVILTNLADFGFIKTMI